MEAIKSGDESSCPLEDDILACGKALYPPTIKSAARRCICHNPNTFLDSLQQRHIELATSLLKTFSPQSYPEYTTVPVPSLGLIASQQAAIKLRSQTLALLSSTVTFSYVLPCKAKSNSFAFAPYYFAMKADQPAVGSFCFTHDYVRFDDNGDMYGVGQEGDYDYYVEFSYTHALAPEAEAALLSDFKPAEVQQQLETLTFTPVTDGDYLDDGSLAPSQIQYQAVYFGDVSGEGYEFGGEGEDSSTTSLSWDDTQSLTSAQAQGSRRRLREEAGVATRRLSAEENDDNESSQGDQGGTGEGENSGKQSVGGDSDARGQGQVQIEIVDEGYQEGEGGQVLYYEFDPMGENYGDPGSAGGGNNPSPEDDVEGEQSQGDGAPTDTQSDDDVPPVNVEEVGSSVGYYDTIAEEYYDPVTFREDYDNIASGNDSQTGNSAPQEQDIDQDSQPDSSDSPGQGGNEGGSLENEAPPFQGQGAASLFEVYNGKVNAVYLRAFDAWVEAYDFRRGIPNDGVFQPFVEEMKEVAASCQL